MVGSASELIVALDVSTRDEVLRLRDALAPVVDFFKVGKELFTAEGPAILGALAGSRIFLDLKFHDIPATVAGGVTSSAAHGVHILDVHALGGRAMMMAAVAARRVRTPLIFGVTVLTHLGDNDLRELGFLDGSLSQVVRLARMAEESGLDGVVASAFEVEAIREATEDRLQILVPGVRPAGAQATHDQKRVATPGEAARRGARYVVVGRAITRDVDPRDAARRIVDEIASA
jgi:orotidine-5'-phosphate decarboxylase